MMTDNRTTERIDHPPRVREAIDELMREKDATDNRMTELLPCSFCGSEYAQVRYMGGKWQEPSAFDSGYRGECCECGALTAAYGTEAEAIAAWNTRAERTCEVESKIFIEGEYVLCPYYEYEMGCGGQFRWDDVEPPTYCPNCGRRVE